MEKVIKNPSTSNVKLASNKASNNKTNADLNKTGNNNIRKEFMLKGLG